MRLKVGNLGGTIYFDSIPLVRFKFIKGSLVFSELLNTNHVLPFEFEDMGINEESIIKFFDERITPDTRIGIHERLKETPIEYYYPERIIRYSSGRCIHDRYWLECDDDEACWQN